MDSNNTNNDSSDIGFKWWLTWAWLGLIIGNISILFSFGELSDLAIIIMAINTIVMVMILRFNKYAFLIATILSLNPIVWIINGIYLKNRWKHPKVNR
jgi:hypothetical protein|tara:strand:+ start:210 stop:503 length:294 start_codon:yes stop_codon:yes gene_type:complete